MALPWASPVPHAACDMHRSSAAARWRVTALLASIVGASASAYLLVGYLTGRPGICLTGSGCDVVRASAFAYPLGIPTPLIGLLFYLAAAGLVIRGLNTRRLAGLPPEAALCGVAVVGAIASMILTGLEAFVIEAFCSWCLVQAAASLVLLAASIGLVTTAPEPVVARSGRARQRAAQRLQDERSSLHRTARIGGGMAALAVASLLAVGGTTGAPRASTDHPGLTPAGSPRLGSGVVEIVEFADFQCPGCAALAPIMADLAASDAMTLAYRYFPLDSVHRNADASARAAVAADRQGAFWQISAAMYARQAAWKDLSPADVDDFFAALADELGLDDSRWQADYESRETAAVVNADREAALALGLTGTPTLFIDGREYTGPLSLDGIRAAIAAAMP
jgi:protein-disulfide isomerase